MTHLFVVLTRGTGVLSWWRHGMLDRELALYRRYVASGVPVTLVSLSRSLDRLAAPRVLPLRLLARRRRETDDAYGRRVAAVVARTPGAVVKSNQMPGADWAGRVAAWAGAPFLARCGYSYAYHAAQDHGEDSPEHLRALKTEATALAAADHVVATTPRILEHLRRHDADVPATVVPNYVDTERFRPRTQTSGARPVLLSIGRLVDQKNYHALLEAVEGLDVEVLLVGTGPHRDGLRADAARRGVRLRILDPIPHRRLPRLHARATLYVQPSLYEGHPKALLEAMASALPVVASRVPGVEEVLDDGVTGYFGGPDAASLRAAVQRALEDPDGAEAVGRRARAVVEAACSLDAVFDLERSIVERFSEAAQREARP